MATVEITTEPRERVPEFRPGLVFEYYGTPYMVVWNRPIDDNRIQSVCLESTALSHHSRHGIMVMMEDESPNLRILGYVDHIALTVEEV